jgi:hypothetical protein
MWGFVFLAVSTAQGKETGLEEGFLSPPPSSRPHTWWHWMNGMVTQEGITADLEAMARVGVGGAQIFNVGDKGSVNIPDGPAPFMSPQWLDLVHHAAQEADRLGVELCLHNCAGWSSSGGPWIDPEHAMQIITLSEKVVEGPKSCDIVLDQPPTRLNCYREIAVLAFPTPEDSAYRIKDYRIKAGFDSRYGVQPDLKPVPDKAIIQRKKLVDLSAKVTAGKLTWDVPAGRWTILRIGYTPTGKDNHPAPEAGRGLECDKLSREAMDLHWDKGVAPILNKLGPLAGKSLNNSLIDSYEVGCNNWTPKFREEFQKRRGYDLLTYLPTLSGRVVDSGEGNGRVRWGIPPTMRGRIC